MFNLSNEGIKKNNAVHTVNEIYHQPEVWEEMRAILAEQEAEIRSFLDGIFAKHARVRVVMAGAGTSAFIGDVLAPVLQKQHGGHVQFEGVPTTDIVSNPEAYFVRDVPTVLVSFARSGNSPESVASVSLGEQLVDDFYQVVVTCNKDGKLAENIKGDARSITILTPEKAHDQSLAMTSAFSCMMIAAYSIFARDGFDFTALQRMIADGEALVERVGDKVDAVLGFDFDRIAYLGSGPLGELAHEAALKMLELSAGEVVAMHESSLGFRHGPKSVLTPTSAVVIFMSGDAYTRKYDMDILRELAAAESGMKVIAVMEHKDADVEKLADWTVVVDARDDAGVDAASRADANADSESLPGDFYRSLLYVIFAQVLAVKKSMALGITPDNPSADGAINRVVQGVTIYDYEE